jgi:hypothetical protein
MTRGRASNRHHRARVVAARRRLALDAMRWDYPVPGRLAKWNLVCSCDVCSGARAARQAVKAARRDHSFLEEDP